MRPKANSQAAPSQPAETGVSGKRVIIGILLLALVAAGGSWLFRYNATHRAAKFWGPENAAAIRDAPIVTFSTFTTPIIWSPHYIGIAGEPIEHLLAQKPQTTRDVTSARGLVHLRNALLEDRSFDWESESLYTSAFWPETKWSHAIVFSDETKGVQAYLLFAPDSQLTTFAGRNAALSYKPIARGIAEMFAEFEFLPSNPPTPPSR
jgi:hypothetical protein